MRSRGQEGRCTKHDNRAEGPRTASTRLSWKPSKHATKKASLLARSGKVQVEANEKIINKSSNLYYIQFPKPKRAEDV